MRARPRVSTAPANPHLAAQGRDYIATQLALFKSGARPSPIMQPMAAGLSPEDMLAVGAYYESQKPVEGMARDKALAERGHDCHAIYVKNDPSQLSRFRGAAG